MATGTDTIMITGVTEPPMKEEEALPTKMIQTHSETLIFSIAVKLVQSIAFKFWIKMMSCKHPVQTSLSIRAAPADVMKSTLSPPKANRRSQ